MKDLGSNAAKVFTGPKTIIYLKKRDKLDEKKIAAVLAKHEKIQRDDTQTL